MRPPTFKPVPAQPWMIHALGCAVVVAAAAAFYLGFFAPSARDIAFRNQRMQQLDALVESKATIAEDHAQLSQRLGQLKNMIAGAKKRMPRRSPSQEFIERVSKLASQHDVQVEMCSASAPQTFPSHAQVEITCRLKGSYAGLCRYLAAVDQLSQMSKVSRLELSSDQDSRAYPAQVVFQLYYRPEPHDTEMKRGTL